MKKIYLFIIVLMLSSLFAQEREVVENSSRNSNKAILFNFDNFSLNSFNGGIGIKYWPSNKTAYVGKINISHLKGEKEKTGFSSKDGLIDRL